MRRPRPLASSTFITLTTAGRAPRFGHRDGGRFVPTALGRLVQACWLSVPFYHPRCGLDAFALGASAFHAVVHLHGRPAAGEAPSLGDVVTEFRAAVEEAALIAGLGTGPGLWEPGWQEKPIEGEAMLRTVRGWLTAAALRRSA